MGQIIEEIVNTFDGGMADDTRVADSNEFALTHHFDTYSQRHQLIPYRDMEAEAGSLAAYNIKSVELFTDSGGTQNLYALGNVSGQTYPQILEKSANMVTGTFAVSTTGAGAAGTVIATSLKGYKSLLYFLKTVGSNTIVDSYNPVTDVYTSTVGTIAATSSTGVYPKPFRHPLDDILYIAAGNIIAKLDNTTFTAQAFVVPSDLIITSLCDHGVYLAIACAPKDQGRKSFVLFWGRDTSIVEADESVDAGEGALMVIEDIEGELVGISAAGQSAGQVFDIAPKITISVYSQGYMNPVKEVRWEGTGTPTTLLSHVKAKKNQELFFAAKQYVENKTVNQIWVVGKNKAGSLFVTPDRLANNDTALTGSVDGFSIIGDYMWVAYNADGSLKRTKSTAAYTATSIYESKIFNGKNSALTKSMIGLSVMFAPLPSGATVVVKWRRNEETAFTALPTAYSYSTQNAISYGFPFVGDFKEVSFRLESTGGAAITGFKFKYEVSGKESY